jgi:hypothetical protein
MLTACYAQKSFLRIVLTVLAVMVMAGCVAKDGGSLAGVGDVTVSGGDGGGSGPSTGSFSLAWTAPVIRQDGSPMSLAEIDGYRVYFGDTQGDYPNSVDINDGAASTTTVSNVPVGNYYIVMTTYDSGGRESPYSGVVNKQAL